MSCHSGRVQFLALVLIGTIGKFQTLREITKSEISVHQLDLITLSSAAEWAIDESQTIRLLGAHGEEIVRSVYIDSQVGLQRKGLRKANL